MSSIQRCMEMTWQAWALIGAGVIGGSVALVHGVLVQRLMVAPFLATPAGTLAARRLVPPLLQFSTYNWLLGGLALIAAALWLGPEARLAIGLLVGSAYLYGAIGNFWGVRSLHPGWMLYGLALALIAAALAF